MGEGTSGWLLTFRLRPELERSQRTRFFQQLYGYKDRSQYGKYFYQREGVLSYSPYIRLGRAVIMIGERDKKRVLSFLRRGARVEIRRVILTQKDRDKLYPSKKR